MFKIQNHTFKHGVHPPEKKEETNKLPIRQFSFAPLIILPVSQQIGAPAVIIVREGQEVVRGQLLAKADGFLSVPLHAPVTGEIVKISNVPTISGKMTLGIYLKPFPSSTQEILEGNPIDVDNSTPEEILKAIQNAGIVGL